MGTLHETNTGCWAGENIFPYIYYFKDGLAPEKA